jgi:hypothetical protein
VDLISPGGDLSGEGLDAKGEFEAENEGDYVDILGRAGWLRLWIRTICMCKSG